jgi:streptogramin lyase
MEVVMRRLLMVLAVVVAVPGPAYAQESKYYELPKGDYPHDVAAGPSGEVWFWLPRIGLGLGMAGRAAPVMRTG